MYDGEADVNEGGKVLANGGSPDARTPRARKNKRRKTTTVDRRIHNLRREGPRRVLDRPAKNAVRIENVRKSKKKNRKEERCRRRPSESEEEIENVHILG